MQPEQRTLTIAPHDAVSKRANPWQTSLAFALAVPLGIGAGLLTYAAGMGSLVALGFFSLACTLLLGSIAMRYSIVVGLTTCAAMCVTLLVQAMLFNQRIGRPPDPSGDLGLFAVTFVISGLLSLSVSIPFTLVARRDA